MKVLPLLYQNGDFRLYKTKSPIFVLLCALCFQSQPFRFLFCFTAAGVRCRVAAVKCLPILHHSPEYTFFLRDHSLQKHAYSNI